MAAAEFSLGDRVLAYVGGKGKQEVVVTGREPVDGAPGFRGKLDSGEEVTGKALLVLKVLAFAGPNGLEDPSIQRFLLLQID